MDEKKKKILNFLKSQYHGVISTVDTEANQPESAVVAFSETDNLDLIFGTFSDTRKFKNIKNNDKISFVIGWDDITIQYEGRAQLMKGADEECCREIHLKKNPSSIKYVSDTRQKFFKVTPLWIRYTDPLPHITP